MFEKIKTILWFLKKPVLYSQLLNLAKQRVFPNPKENTRKKATKWCQEACISYDEAILKITGSAITKTVRHLHPVAFEYADRKVEEIPITLGGAGCLDLLYYLSEYTKATKVIETGVAYGWSSLALLLSLINRTNSKLVSIDMPYPKVNNEGFVGNIVDYKLQENWILLRESDLTGIPKAISNLKEIDFCHYDSDKTYSGRVWAYPKLWSSLKIGGIFISDDISDNIAFKEFCEDLNIVPLIVAFENKFIGVLEKV